jgi:hypothetical protein
MPWSGRYSDVKRPKGPSANNSILKTLRIILFQDPKYGVMK